MAAPLSPASWPPPVLRSASGREVLDAPGVAVGGEADEQPMAIWALFVSTLSHVMLAGLLWMSLWATLPRLAGWQPTVITGGSMMPTIQAGDIVVTRDAPATAMVPGAVITFEDPSRPGSLVTHRIVEVSSAGYTTRGDNNGTSDPQVVAPESVRGRALLRLPWLGLPLLWMQQGAWFPLVALVLLIGSMSWIVVKFPV